MNKICLFFGLFWFGSVSSVGANYIQLDAVADVKTRFSAGCSSVQELANLAQNRNIDTILVSDNDRRSLEYGIVPFEKIFRKKKEQPSILTNGVPPYLAEINNTDQKLPDTLLIPAVESAPFYYWTGNLVKKNLTANHWDKHLLVVGLDRPEDYEQLPILNSNFSQKYRNRFLKTFGIYAGLTFFFFILYVRKIARKTSFFFLVIFGMLAANNHPFKSSPYSPYEGDTGIAPYQELIDYANSKEAMVFWNHLETETIMGQEEPMGIKTLPHPEDLLLSRDYTGFQAVYDGEIHVTDPGKEWDQVLKQYIDGDRKKPVWGYGGNDFHCEGEDGHTLGGVRTVLLVREKTRNAVLESMRKGRMYAVKQSGEGRLSLDDFKVIDRRSGQEATHGEVLFATDYPELKIGLRFTKGAGKPMVLHIIRNGKLVKRQQAALPYELVWRDTGIKREGRQYYRVMVKMDNGNFLVSNPVFLNFSIGAPPQVASLPPETAGSSDKAEVPNPPVPPTAPKKPSVQAVETQMMEMEPKTPEVRKSLEPTAPLEPGPPLSELNQPKTPVIPEPLTPEIPEPQITAAEPKMESKPTPNSQATRQETAKENQAAINPASGTLPAEGMNPEVGNPLERKIESNKDKTVQSSLMDSKPGISPTQTVAIKSQIPSASGAAKAPTSPKTATASGKKFVTALIDGVTLKKGPGVMFKEIGTAKKGERLVLLRRMNATFNGKPWLEVKKGKHTLYVWGGLVQLAQ